MKDVEENTTISSNLEDPCIKFSNLMMKKKKKKTKWLNLSSLEIRMNYEKHEPI